MTSSQSDGNDLLRLMQEAERDWLDAARAADIVAEVAAEKKAKYQAIRETFDLAYGERSR
ncbi:MAG TPA: hypothetical protein VK595_07655 [Vicinamibacterales bacterium]|nr:hypothetical protein [Vicinamibacterales bacterium]